MTKPPSDPQRPASAPILTPPEAFPEQVRALGVEFETGDLDRLGHFLGLLLEANESFNLTAITDPAEAWRRHILDAMTLVPVLASIAESSPPAQDAAEGAHESGSEPVQGQRLTWAARESGASAGAGGKGGGVIDIGSGGGVPALPLAIVLPDFRFTMVESTGKKAQYLDRTAKALNLSNARVLNDRAENLGQSREHRERYDVAMARALGHLAVVCELCAPLVRPGGVVVAVKGQKADQELAESKRALGWLGLRHVETIDTPTGRLVILEKTTRTPRTYPRKAGEPARVPLGVPRDDDHGDRG